MSKKWERDAILEARKLGFDAEIDGPGMPIQVSVELRPGAWQVVTELWRKEEVESQLQEAVRLWRNNL